METIKENSQCAKRKNKDSGYVIVGVILAVVALLLNVFLWHDDAVFWGALISSVILIVMLYVAIDENNNGPFSNSKDQIYNYDSFAFGIGLINFAVVIIAKCILGSILGFMIGLIVWEIINIERSETQNHVGLGFWLGFGPFIYGVAWIMPIWILGLF